MGVDVENTRGSDVNLPNPMLGDLVNVSVMQLFACVVFLFRLLTGQGGLFT